MSNEHRYRWPENLKWSGNDLRLGRKVIVRIEPDANWTDMWRVQYPDGKLSDMVNLTRARDAARRIAMQLLSPQQDTRQTAIEACLVAKSA